VQCNSAGVLLTCLFQYLCDDLTIDHSGLILGIVGVCFRLSGVHRLNAGRQSCHSGADARFVENLGDEVMLLLGAALQQHATAAQPEKAASMSIPQANAQGRSIAASLIDPLISH